MQTRTWDIFCKVIDNYGDIGCCWRLSQQLAAQGQTVRLITDDVSALSWMAGDSVRIELVEILTWDQASTIKEAADVVIEAFGCELPETYVSLMANSAPEVIKDQHPQWINLEYLTAESYAERNHLLPSPVLSGAGRGLVKTFFYPGFTARTGGLLREPDLAARIASFDKAAWLKKQNIAWQGERIISLFCYEPKALPTLLQELSESTQPTLLLVTAGRATNIVRAEPVKARTNKNLRIHYLPHLTQTDYDHLLWVSDFNFVRGEDSLIRAIWAGKPFVWHIYPQDDNAHHVKLNAFLDLYLANADEKISAHIKAVHYFWNSITNNTIKPCKLDIDSPFWQVVSHSQSELWQALPDLVTQLTNLTAQ